jgi:hypothetical protein
VFVATSVYSMTRQRIRLVGVALYSLVWDMVGGRGEIFFGMEYG